MIITGDVEDGLIEKECSVNLYYDTVVIKRIVGSHQPNLQYSLTVCGVDLRQYIRIITDHGMFREMLVCDL